MGIVTGRTVVLLDRAVALLVLGQEVLHIDNFAVRRIQGLVVAHHTGIHRRPDQLFHIIGDMGIVADEALPLGRQAAVLGFNVGNPLFFVFMTCETEVLRALSGKIVLEFPPMGAVALDAALLHRFMTELLVLESVSLVRMAGKADIVSRSAQHFGIVRLVRAMTEVASPAHRGMSEGVFSYLFVMANKAEVLPLSPEHKPVRGLVRIMAFRTVALPHRCMNALFRINALMAFIAQIRGLLDRRKLVITLLNVADIALPDGNRSMNKFILAHSAMAFVGYTCINGLGRLRRPPVLQRKYHGAEADKNQAECLYPVTTHLVSSHIIYIRFSSVAPITAPRLQQPEG